MTLTISRPAVDEFAPHYASYIEALPQQADIFDILEQQRTEVAELLRVVAETDWGTFRYEPGKWSVNDVICHVNDAERIFAYRALRIARGDKTPLPGWEENDYAAAAGADSRETEELAAEFDIVRQATIALFKSLEPEAVVRRGTANNTDVSVRALAYIIAGHVAHHVRILRERYQIKADR
jgi:hypothetical protein